MKKRISFFLALCLLLSSTVLLGACKQEHAVHTYRTEWRRNDTRHWHACKNEACNFKKDEGEHTWDTGKISVPPTKKKDGKLVYTCTVCGYERTESVPYVFEPKLADEAAWIASFAALQNCKATVTGIARNIATGASSSEQRLERFEIAGGNYLYSDYNSEQKDFIYIQKDGRIMLYSHSHSDASTAWTVENINEIPSLMERGTLVPVFQTQSMYASFTFNEATQRYEAQNVVYNRPAKGDTVTVKTAYVGFDNGKLDYFGYITESDRNGVLVEQDIRVTFEEHGTIVVEPPKMR